MCIYIYIYISIKIIYKLTLSTQTRHEVLNVYTRKLGRPLHPTAAALTSFKVLKLIL